MYQIRSDFRTEQNSGTKLELLIAKNPNRTEHWNDWILIQLEQNRTGELTLLFLL